MVGDLRMWLYRAACGNPRQMRRRRPLFADDPTPPILVGMRRTVAIALAALGTVIGGAAAAGSSHPRVEALRLAASAQAGYVYPLKLSSNRRYLVDQRGRPFMIVGDSPQAMIGNLTLQDAATFIADRKAAGFNSLLVDLLCAKYTGCRDDGSTIDGVKPFTTPGDLSTPNPAYFARAETFIRLAAGAGMVVFLDPIETGGWLGTLKSNGPAKDYAYGQFLSRRFKALSNIVWMNGNDFQSWSDPADDAVVLAVARGIRSVVKSQLQTIELNYLVSASLDDPRWQPVVGLDAAYTYSPTYAEVLKEYNRKPFVPVFMVEAGYEFEQNISAVSYGNPATLRRQEYWSMLSGATGQFYGNHYTWQFADGWKENLDTPGSTQIGYLVKLFSGRPWYKLVPDQAHKLVSAGYGTPSSTGDVDSSDYVTTAATRDGTLAISYLPAGGTISVELARLAGPVKAQWYDPSNGTYKPVAGSPFPSSGRVDFTSPGKNAGGDTDWVLVLTAR
jgi:Protein of unknown function (DUF4038)/Putative collagen-binding domain of a collagenase